MNIANRNLSQNSYMAFRMEGMLQMQPWASHWSAKGPLKSHLTAPGISNCALVQERRLLFMKTSVSPAWEHHLGPQGEPKTSLTPPTPHLTAPGISNGALVHVRRLLFMKTSVSLTWEHHLEPQGEPTSPPDGPRDLE